MNKHTRIIQTFDSLTEELNLEEKIRGSSDWIFAILKLGDLTKLKYGITYT